MLSTPKIKKKHAKEAYVILNKLIFSENITLLKNAIHTMYVGWVSSPLELSPEERLDMSILYEDLQEHLSSIQNFEKKVTKTLEL